MYMREMYDGITKEFGSKGLQRSFSSKALPWAGAPFTTSTFC